MTDITPIFVDRAAKKSDYSGLDRDELLVTEIFYTIQGEGPFAGEPAVFVRLAGCNYGGKGVTGNGCRFCDTFFSLGTAKTMDFGEVLKEIDKKHLSIPPTGKQRKLVVITGGEPLLQGKAVGRFVNYCYTYNSDFTFQLETNGTCDFEGIPDDVFIVLSPKVPERPNGSAASYPHLPLRRLARADCLKILVSADWHSPYHRLPEFVSQYVEVTRRKVYISPINSYSRAPDQLGTIWDENGVYNTKECMENHRYASRLCMEEGYHLSIQQHLFAAVP